MKLVIVESPTKAKTINKYLGSDYKVLSSYGHVRELKPKDGSVDVDHDFKMKYQWIARNKKNIDAIVAEAKKSELVYLASDPDREGEAIAMALQDLLGTKAKINKEVIKRIAFNEINKQSVLAALKNARSVDDNLVDAQQARLALDYLVGFNLSPVLWKKMPGSKSAGRVQSVALRLISDREMEIRAFKPSEYWSLDAEIEKSGKGFEIKMSHYEGKKFSNSFPKEEKVVDAIISASSKDGKVKVTEVKSSKQKQRPLPPFTTSLLQQEASRKLGFTSKKTMKIAQELYEGISVKGSRDGLITYMRTDGMFIAKNAIDEIRGQIEKEYGDEYLPDKPHMYKTKMKNAQEAHEAIRVTKVSFSPDSIKSDLSFDQFKLYSLIWKRTMACQMSVAIKEVSSISFSNVNIDNRYSVSSTKIIFPGFLKVYSIDSEIDHVNSLPDVKVDDVLDILKFNKQQHFTKPPARFNEASLIKAMEELGIGRPSTYSSIISILQERGYVSLIEKRFNVQPRGIMVTSFLKKFFSKYVEFDFTAKLENDLDLISSGEIKRIDFLQSFWKPFHDMVSSSFQIDITEVSQTISDDLKQFFVSDDMEGLLCEKCSSQTTFKVGPYGPYFECQNEDCKHKVNLHALEGDKLKIEKDGYVFELKNGPYGQYVDVIKPDGKTKKVTIPKTEKDISEDTVVKYGMLPMELGSHPDDGKKISLNIGRFGPYLSYDSMFFSIKKGNNFFDTTLDEALEIIGKDVEKKRMSVSYVHPKTKKNIKIGINKKGVYIYYQRKYYNIDNIKDPKEISLEESVEIIKGGNKTSDSEKTKKASVKKKGTAKKKSAAPKKAAKK